MSRIQLRGITEDDLEFARQIRNANRDMFFYSKEITEEDQKRWWKTYLSTPREKYTLYIIWLGDKRIGTTSLSKIPDGYEFGNNIILDEYRGCGYFREVFQEIMRIVGDATLVAYVLHTNSHMKNVYRKFSLFEYSTPDYVEFRTRRK